MASIIKSHGLKFNIEGSGFLASNAMDDFAIACDELEAALDNLDAVDVARIHAGARMNAETGDFPNKDARNTLDDMASAACEKATESWRDPSAAFIMVSPW